MNGAIETFNRYARALARLFDPEVAQSSAVLVPVDASAVSPPIGKTRRKPLQTSTEPFAATSSFDPMSHGSLTAAISFLEQQELAVLVTPPKSLREPRATPKISPTPATLHERVALFPEQTINALIKDGKSVELLWQAADQSTPQRVVMNYQRQQRFRSTVGVEPGDYLFAYVVNNRMRPDSRYGQRVLVRPDAVLARVIVPRQARSVMLRNHNAAHEVVRLKADVPWLIPEISQLRVPGRATVPVLLRLAPEKMFPDENHGRLSILARRDGVEVEAAAVEVIVKAEVKGAIPEFEYHPHRFEWVRQGVDRLEVQIDLRARGQGPLRGTIITQHLAEPRKFELQAGNLDWSCPTFVVNSAELPYRTEGSIKVTLLTDSYLANHRFFEIEIPYRLLYLKKSLPALVFRSVPPGATRTTRLEVKRSDGKKVDLKVFIPEDMQEHLTFYSGIHSHLCSFCFDTRNLPPEATIKGEVILVDTRSGLRDRIKVSASVGKAMPAPVGP